jgi:hypothetical protein
MAKAGVVDSQFQAKANVTIISARPKALSVYRAGSSFAADVVSTLDEVTAKA